MEPEIQSDIQVQVERPIKHIKSVFINFYNDDIIQEEPAKQPEVESFEN